MMKKDKNNQDINNIPKYLWGNYFKNPIKWLAHLINNYGNSKHSFITTGTSYAYAIRDEKRRHPELTELQIHEIVNLRIKQNRKKLGLPTGNNTTPSLAAAGLALGSLYYPWLAVPDIIFDTAASIDEPSTSNNLHTIADFPETVAKFTPSKIDDYVAKGVLTLGNIDDAVSTSGRNMFSNFNKKSGKINNTTDKTSVRESTNIKYRKQGGKMNIIEFLKKGSGIHIKKKNRGKFTDYCGGKVTDECIRKAKASGNPTLVKRATFAANARKWKHKKGGKAFVNGVNVLDSNPKMSKAASRRIKKADDGTKLNAFLKVLNSDTGKAIGRTLMNGLSAGFQAKQMNNAINEYELASKAKLKKIMNGISTKDYYDQVLLQMNPNENLSLIVLNTRAYALALQDALKKVNEAKDESDLQLNKLKQLASEQDNFSNIFGGIVLLGSLLNNKPASKVDNGTPSNSYFDNYANNYTKQLFNIKS